MDYGTYDPASAQDMLTDVVPSQPQTMLPMTRRARLMQLQKQAAEMEGAQPDVSQLQEFARMQGQAGEASMLNALAAQYAGEQFQPVQAQFLRRAMAAQEPMKIGGGMLTPDGKFIRDPFAAQERGLSRLDRQIQLEQGALTAEEREQERRADAAQRERDRRADVEQRRQDALAQQEWMRRFQEQSRLDRIAAQEQGRKDRFLIAGIDEPGTAQPAPTQGQAPGFYETKPPKLNENQSKARTQASGMAQHIPEMVDVLRDGYRPNRTDLLAAGPALAGTGGIIQGIVPRGMASPQGEKFMTAGRKTLSLLLRGESGGAITADEWTQYGPMYLPWPGDSDAEVERKIKSLQRYTNDVAFQAGPSARAWKSFDINAPIFKPKDGDVVDLTPRRR